MIPPILHQLLYPPNSDTCTHTHTHTHTHTNLRGVSVGDGVGASDTGVGNTVVLDGSGSAIVDMRMIETLKDSFYATNVGTTFTTTSFNKTKRLNL